MPLENRKSSLIQQSGVIPYRVRQGRLEIALVTARNGAGWTIPKGHIEPDLTPAASAAKEALEEAGVCGRVGRKIVGKYSYEKRGRLRQVSVFGMRVNEVQRYWPEMNQRRRQWFSVSEAASRVRSAELRCCMQKLSKQLSAAA
jgi:8-oxo-dGTP pyrophosphatase MutT (NUDIX family)